MEVAIIEKKRKRLFAFICILFLLPLTVGFVIVDLLEGDTLETVINVLVAFTLIATFMGIKKLGADLLVYRFGLAVLSLAFLYNVSIGSGKETVLYWLFIFPLVYVFFLGKREGGIAFAVFFCMLCVLLINPLSFEIYTYNLANSLRFLSSILLVMLMACGLEVSREKYGLMLMNNYAELIAEKQRLEKALKEIKTLNGLIPICSNCKKIRDDQGYWQQVEIYVRDHSEADFSHGICPECFVKIYPDFENQLE